MIILIAAIVLLAEPTVTFGRVVSVHDGDTITVLDADKRQHKIRLDAIDAPELGQPFGRRAKQELADLVADKEVSVTWSKRDRYGRILGRVELDGEWINRDMIFTGWAWHYRAFSKSEELQRAEDVARARRRGLWFDDEPVPPWDWRKTSHKKTSTSPRNPYSTTIR